MEKLKIQQKTQGLGGTRLFPLPKWCLKKPVLCVPLKTVVKCDLGYLLGGPKDLQYRQRFKQRLPLLPEGP